MKSHRKIVTILLLCIVGMFGFTYSLIPLYRVFCKVTGLNGKVDLSVESSFARYKGDGAEEATLPNRLITVEFDVNRNPNLRCDIIPEHVALVVKPGQLNTTSYYVKNLTNQALVIQAIPSISPGKAAKHLKKLECFCFSQQTLQPMEEAKLPLRFWLEPEIPDSVHRLTLSYTLFDVTSKQ